MSLDHWILGVNEGFPLERNGRQGAVLGSGGTRPRWWHVAIGGQLARQTGHPRIRYVGMGQHRCIMTIMIHIFILVGLFGGMKISLSILMFTMFTYYHVHQGSRYHPSYPTYKCHAILHRVGKHVCAVELSAEVRIDCGWMLLILILQNIGEQKFSGTDS